MASKMDARLLKSTKFPPEFNQKVDMEKVNLPVMKKFVLPADATLLPVKAHTLTFDIAGGLRKESPRSSGTRTMC